MHNPLFSNSPTYDRYRLNRSLQVNYVVVKKPDLSNEALPHPVGSRNTGAINPLVQVILLSLDAKKSAIGRVFLKVYYVKALPFMLREKGSLCWKKQSGTCCLSSPRVSAPKFPLRESKCKTIDRSNLDEISIILELRNFHVWNSRS
ncbi:hypothetical protein NPIL_93571 [Nephila pilipes]|uniref:Uncharacterized protein n=1 Tax=Nephila pilipes TaxID=299642 RepID=A0A8X6PF95_NEPPI|nr:hypothetical protein NPIL_370041 [Nephila pilipes]GFT61432.1 hypothetical protein NPIL_93571 [Nephila pilipes]